jgi:hypothetical protein
MEKILIDVGSSTIKVYKLSSGKLKPLIQRSIPFKEDFDPEGGISQSAKKELFELIDSVKEENKESPIKVYATGIFRKLTNETRISFIDEFFERTGLFFNIISQDLENFYLEMALIGKCSLNEPILLINIGGGSTELVVMYGKEAIERKNIDLGVGIVNTKFPEINQSLSKVKLEEVTKFVRDMLPVLSNKVKIAFYTGGELAYMQLAGYSLKKNDLFKDEDHPFLISITNFIKRNEEIFRKVTLQELESLMPDDPKWMHGARGCSAIAQAICQKYGIKTIIPSNSNLIDGVTRQEFRYITISGSFRKHLDYILKVKTELESKGTKVLSPRFTEPKNPGEKFVVFSGEEGLSPLALERHHLKSIAESDALIVCDPEGYVGASALLEIGFANAIGKRIIFVEKPEEFMLNTLPAEIGL